MKTSSFLLVALCLLLLSNKISGQQKSDNAQILPYRINIEQIVTNVKSVPLSTLGSSLEYIPLQTDPDILLSRVSNIAITDSFLFVTDGTKLLKFGKNGKYLKQIGTPGRGPGEYARIADLMVDKIRREVYVLAPRLVLIYDFNGQMKRSFKFDFPSNQFIMKDGNTLIFHPFNLSMPTPDPVYSLYITDKNGVILSKIVNTLKRINRGISVPTSPLYMFGGTPHFMEFGIDTLYTFNGTIRKPYAIFQPGKLRMNPDPLMAEVPELKGKIWVSDIKEAGRLMFTKIWWNMTDSISNCIFDKSSLTFTALKENGFINDIDGGAVFWPKKIIDNNVLVDYVDAFELLKQVSKPQQPEVKPKDPKKAEQLKTLSLELTETSNPVIIILK